MAKNAKYGKVTLEHGSIGEDEPVIVFRAKDVLLPKVLAYYVMCCIKAGSPKRHIDMIFETIKTVERWQLLNNARVPTSENSKSWRD